VVFGDSLSDNGNLFKDCPDKVSVEHYWQGRNSNGYVWVEYLAGEELFRSSQVNNAYVGANSRVDVILIKGEEQIKIPGLLSQVDNYIGNTITMPKNALFVIWIGANDLFDYIDGNTATYPNCAENIKIAMERLTQFGAESFLILNLPDLGATPHYFYDSEEENKGKKEKNEKATRSTFRFNLELTDAVKAFKADEPTVTVYEMNIFTLFHKIIKNPENYGFKNVTEVSSKYFKEDQFDNSEGHLFWDFIHPTTEAHKVIAEQTMLFINGKDMNTPETGSSSSSCFLEILR